MSLLVLGTVALDDVETPHGRQKNLLGGSAAHFAMSAGLFTEVHVAGVVGEDLPPEHRAFLKRRGLDLSSLLTCPAKTFRWRGEYKKEDLNTAVTLHTELGVLGSHVPQAAEHQRGIPVVFLANYDPEVQMKFLQSLKRPRLVGLDSMNLWIHHKREALLKLLKRVDMFVVNDREARDLTAEDNLIRAAKALRKMGPKMIVIKKGEHGSVFFSDDLTFAYPAYPVETVIDPTGAGDTFAGGLMGYLAQCPRVTARSLRQSLLYATVLASFNVEDFGLTRSAALTKSMVEARLKKFLKFISVP